MTPTTGLWLALLASPAVQAEEAEEASAPDAPLGAKDAVQVGAEALGIEPAFIEGVREGMELFYLRSYPDARKHFAALEEQFPGTGVGAVSDVLVWQALMIENFDFRYERQWRTASRRARDSLSEPGETPGLEAWRHLMLGSIAGIEGIHALRRERYLRSLRRGLEAVGHLQEARERVPDLPDMRLGEGIYNYWRTAISERSRAVPDFGDHRDKGIGQMHLVREEGVFLAGPAALSAAFAYMDRQDLSSAVASAEELHARYPDNVINNLMLGRLYGRMRRHDDALEIFDRVIEVAPNNRIVHLYRGTVLLRARRHDEAKEALGVLFRMEPLESWHRSHGLVRLGQLHYRLENYEAAEVSWRAAVREDGNRVARARLQRLRRMRREGRR